MRYESGQHMCWPLKPGPRKCAAFCPHPAYKSSELCYHHLQNRRAR